MWCAQTGDVLYEPTHPRLDEIRLYVIKKWTWINGGVDLPEAQTLFSYFLKLHSSLLMIFNVWVI